MIRRKPFGYLDLVLKAILQNLSPFGGVSLLVVVDFLQLPTVNQKCVFLKPSKGSYRLFNGWLWSKSNCMSWLRLFGRAVIEILLNYLIRFEKVSKKIIT